MGKAVGQPWSSRGAAKGLCKGSLQRGVKALSTCSAVAEKISRKSAGRGVRFSQFRTHMITDGGTTAHHAEHTSARTVLTDGSYAEGHAIGLSLRFSFVLHK